MKQTVFVLGIKNFRRYRGEQRKWNMIGEGEIVFAR